MKYLTLTLYRALWIVPVRTIKFLFVKNYQHLYKVAAWEIKQLAVFGPVSMISAPLFSGGTGEFEKNLNLLKRYISHLNRETKIVWSQIPYLDIKVAKWAKNIEVNTSQKIKDFYIPLIITAGITELICTSGDHSCNNNYSESSGCKAEREAAHKQGITVTNYSNKKFHS